MAIPSSNPVFPISSRRQMSFKNCCLSVNFPALSSNSTSSIRTSSLLLAFRSKQMISGSIRWVISTIVLPYCCLNWHCHTDAPR
ncbi:Uncharacterised protein [Vibrio cholerae]|nr:Uncharacterised protein [Vibrio cholerae]CSA10530.1 Uncharacterised protein [Vibrio cholerae]CSB93327.1 Uncharacterised protein [Vibrio cholerae]CSC93987.1 Uncharacterised protein [Vibrio cholerae]